EKSGNALRAMVDERIESKLRPGFSIERSDLIERQAKTFLWIRAAIQPKNLYRCSTSIPRSTRPVARELARHLRMEIDIGGKLHCFWCPDARELVMAVTCVHPAPMVDNDVGAERADDANHVFEDLVAPDLF